MAFTRRIKCTLCQKEGLIEAHDTIGSVEESELFTLLGKDKFGFLRFRCPGCDEHIAVDPLEVADNPEIMRGISPGAGLYRAIQDEAGTHGDISATLQNVAHSLEKHPLGSSSVRRNQRIGCAVLAVIGWLLLKAAYSPMVATLVIGGLLAFVVINSSLRRPTE